MDLESKRRELEELKRNVSRLEDELGGADSPLGVSEEVFRASGYYGVYYATSGALIGLIGAAASLVFNILGSIMLGKSPMELIRVYLTFPLGEQALRLSDPTRYVYALNDGLILSVGCCLYLFTGMLLGIPVYLILSRYARFGPVMKRVLIASGAAIAIWVILFYAILSWLQPLLFEGRWIAERIPWWVAAATHLVFGITFAFAYPLGEFTPYRRPTEDA